jgi:hypothetical protein
MFIRTLTRPRANRRAAAGITTMSVLSVLTALSAGLPVHAAGKLDLNFIAPESFSDIGHGSYDRERNLKTLADYLQTLAAQLPEGQTLKLEVLDIDLAGELLPRATQEVRVMRGTVDWPQMALRYTLTQNGAALKSGEARLSDLGYLTALRARDTAGGDLAYDKRMLQDWFRKTIATP